jgi:hypothetical protein
MGSSALPSYSPCQLTVQVSDFDEDEAFLTGEGDYFRQVNRQDVHELANCDSIGRWACCTGR